MCLLGAVVAVWLSTRPAAVAAPSEHHWSHDDHRHAELDQHKAQVEQELARLREKEAEEAARKENYAEERKAREEQRNREEQARQQKQAEEERQRAVGATREAMLERAEQASRRMNKYIEHEIDQARAAPAPGLSPAASAGQRTLVLNGASALLRMVQEVHTQGKLDKFAAFDLLNNEKFEWNAPLYRDAVHAEAAHLAATFGDAIPSGRKADQPVTLGAAWECCTKLANP